MGDRTYVELTVLKEHADLTKKIITAEYFEPHDELTQEGPQFTVFGFDGVNSGSLDGLDELQDHGIAFDSNWGRGDNYGSGGDYCRFDENGEPCRKELYDEEESISLAKLKEILDKDIPDLEKLAELDKLIRTTLDEYFVRDWRDQVEWGGIHRARNLIEGKLTYV